MKAKTCLFIIYMCAIMFILYTSVIVHETTHGWQNGFLGREICFVGMDKLQNYSFTEGAFGWYLPDKNYTEVNRIFPNTHIEVDAYFVQGIYILICMVILHLLLMKVVDKVMYAEYIEGELKK